MDACKRNVDNRKRQQKKEKNGGRDPDVRYGNEFTMHKSVTSSRRGDAGNLSCTDAHSMTFTLVIQWDKMMVMKVVDEN